MPGNVIMPELAYRDVAEAIEWLCSRFGFSLRLRIADHRAQLLFDGAAIVVTQATPSTSGAVERLHGILVRVPKVDSHHAHAVALGVKILRPPADHPYGERQYTAEDLGGHVWTFSETIADPDPVTWGGVLHSVSPSSPTC